MGIPDSEMAKHRWLRSPIKGLLLDIAGVLKDGDIPVPGSVDAIKRLQALKFPFRLITNETLKPAKTILNTLRMLEYNISEAELFSPVPALVKILKKENLQPHLLVHPRMIPEFSEVDRSAPNCVVIGDAAEYINYEAMNECFRKLMDMDKPILFSLGQGKYYLDDDGLALDVGSFAKALQYATGVTPRIVGKPSPDYFLSAVNDLNLKPNEKKNNPNCSCGGIESAKHVVLECPLYDQARVALIHGTRSFLGLDPRQLVTETDYLAVVKWAGDGSAQIVPPIIDPSLSVAPSFKTK